MENEVDKHNIKGGANLVKFGILITARASFQRVVM